MKEQKNKVKFILENLVPGMILDLGYMGGKIVGSYVHDCLIKSLGTDVVGIDIQDGADIKYDLNGGIPYPNGNIENIVAGDLIEHLENPFFFLEECHRVLKEDGRLILTTPNLLSVNSILRVDNYEHHLYSWTPIQLRKLIELAGFKIIKEKMGNCWDGKWVILKLFVKLFPRFDREIWFVCKKERKLAEI